jgi:3-hydroxyisobutyrate dehydrogenase-like beta-hydroxyacid dehydrogenase
MTNDQLTPTTVLGMGAMGQALAAALIDTGAPITVWNRTPGRTGALSARGATVATTIEEAVTASPLVVACLLDHESVHDVLDPVAHLLPDRSLVNLTTTSPNQARQLADWAEARGVDYLDGGIMAVPDMIGTPGSTILYSGSTAVFERHGTLFERWGDAIYCGVDAGMASLYDLAMLSGMYVMFAGFLHGAAMVGSEGVPATQFAKIATPFIAAMTASFSEFARIVDDGDYGGDGQQSLEFSDLGDLIRASAEQGVSAAVIRPVQELIERQIAAGHGKEGFARIYEELRNRS